MDRAEEHLGTERATRYLRKFYPWYMESLAAPAEVAEELQRSADLARARELIGGLSSPWGPPKRLAIIPRLPAQVRGGNAVAPGRFWVWELCFRPTSSKRR